GPGPLSRVNGALRHLPDIERGLLRALHSTAPPAEFVATIQALQQVPSKLGFEFDPISGSVSGMLGTPAKAGQAHQPSDAEGPDAAHQPEIDESKEGCIAHVVSPLLTRMLRALASVDVQRTCRELLGALDTRAARENRTIDMFADEERFNDVFERRKDVSDGIAKLKGLLPGLAKELGVRSLDYVSIQNQGDWLIEVPKDQLQKVPRSWHQICATQKVTRYHPPAVRDAINELLVAKERQAATASAAWFSFLKNDFGVQHYAQLKAAAMALSHLDALSSLAAVSKTPNYCRPTFAAPGSPPKLVIRGGRHPMLEAQLAGGKGATTAVPNDLELRSDGVRAAVITGPNMGGKSCLIRQAALTAIMAQIGSFVPADSCELSVCDGVFTRMGASDNLLLGRSTFMEELSDAADTLANATCHSLVIMDELGRCVQIAPKNIRFGYHEH
ncbi:muts domain V-domain-containing protein, partial [Dunaliella salina]